MKPDIRQLDGNGLGTITVSHKVRLVTLCAVTATTVLTMLVPGRSAVLVGVGRDAVVGRLLLRRLGSGLRQGWEAEHGATRVTLGRTPSSRSTIVLRSGGSRGGSRRRRVLVGRPPWVVLGVAREIVRRLRGLSRLGGIVVRRRVVGLLHGKRW